MQINGSKISHNVITTCIKAPINQVCHKRKTFNAESENTLYPCQINTGFTANEGFCLLCFRAFFTVIEPQNLWFAFDGCKQYTRTLSVLSIETNSERKLKTVYTQSNMRLANNNPGTRLTKALPKKCERLTINFHA